MKRSLNLQKESVAIDVLSIIVAVPFARRRILANIPGDLMKELMGIATSFMIVYIMKVTEETLMIMTICL